MTALPACLPAGIAACMVAAGVGPVVGVASAWIDWRGRRRGAVKALSGPLEGRTPREDTGGGSGRSQSLTGPPVTARRGRKPPAPA